MSYAVKADGSWRAINSVDDLYLDETFSNTQPPIATVLAALSPWQVRQVLNITGKRQAVEEYVAAADITVRDAWQFATGFERNNNLIVGAQVELGWSDEDVDAMFVAGAALQSVNA